MRWFVNMYFIKQKALNFQLWDYNLKMHVLYMFILLKRLFLFFVYIRFFLSLMIE